MAKNTKIKSGSKSKAKGKASVKAKAKTPKSANKPKIKVAAKAQKKSAIAKSGKTKGKVKVIAKTSVKATVKAKIKVRPKETKKNRVGQTKTIIKSKPEAKQKAMPVISKTIKPIEKVKEKKLSPASGNGNGPKLRYSDKDLVEFKGIIMEKLGEARKDLELLRSSMSHLDDHGTDDTSPTFKLMEDGSDVLTKEETAQLAARQQKFIKHLEDAMVRIENKSYGICRVTGNLIPKERLRVVPHATLSIEAKQKQF